EEENRALGLQDMHNVVFYDSIPTLQEKLRSLRADPALAQRIAENGRHLAVSRFSFGEVGRSIVDHMRPALRPHPPLSAWQRLRLKLGI
ncbi:MAG: glycosyltransferase, partial [Pseudomonas sp.]